jgi:hypothetical protein
MVSAADPYGRNLGFLDWIPSLKSYKMRYSRLHTLCCVRPVRNLAYHMFIASLDYLSALHRRRGKQTRERQALRIRVNNAHPSPQPIMKRVKLHVKLSLWLII